MRPLSRISAAATAVALALTVSACSKDGDPQTATPSETASATTSTSPTPSGSPSASTSEAAVKSKPVTKYNVICRDTKGLKPFTGTAAVEFGPEKVLDAYCEAADFFFVNSVSNLTQPSDDYTGEELGLANEFLTPNAQQDWKAIMQGAGAGNPDAITRANTLLYYNQQAIADLGYDFPGPDDEVPLSVGGTVSEAQTAVTTLKDGRKALQMWFSVTNNIGLVKDGDEFALPVTRKVALTLLPSNGDNEEHNWLIDGWTTSYQSEKVQPLDEVLAKQAE